jgi:hypothetical protein
MRLLAVMGVVGLLVVPALADWDPGDGHKMHFPQLPDPYGWDVNITRVPGTGIQRVVADDWMCSETGPVTDIHFWCSWEGDFVGELEWIDVEIFTDLPAGHPDNPYSYSIPGESRWYQSFHPTEWTIRDYGIGEQGWYDPFTELWVIPDHQGIFQVNITGIPVPGAFEQVEGEIYWLAISARMVEGCQGQLGWKTSLEHWNDDAVWVDLPPSGDIPWNELRDPRPPYESLDMAFVITPEPATFTLLGLGLLALLRRR